MKPENLGKGGALWREGDSCLDCLVEAHLSKGRDSLALNDKKLPGTWGGRGNQRMNMKVVHKTFKHF